MVAEHRRAFCRGAKVLDLFHVLPLLERNHRAVAEATALVHWRLAPVWQQVRAQLAKHTRKPDQEWVRMQRLMETHPPAAVERAVATALERQSPRLETVRLILRQQQSRPPPACPPVTEVVRSWRGPPCLPRRCRHMTRHRRQTATRRRFARVARSVLPWCLRQDTNVVTLWAPRSVLCQALQRFGQWVQNSLSRSAARRESLAARVADMAAAGRKCRLAATETWEFRTKDRWQREFAHEDAGERPAPSIREPLQDQGNVRRLRLAKTSRRRRAVRHRR